MSENVAKKNYGLYMENNIPQTPVATQSAPSNPTPSESGGNYGLYGQEVSPQQDLDTVFMDEIHKAVSEKNYKNFLQSNIAAYNLKMNARKYLGNTLASQGLGSQGYGTTAHIGVENQAQNLYAQNLENYHQNELDALTEAKQRQETNLLEKDKELAEYLGKTDGSDDQIAAQMSNYGYVQAQDGLWYKKDAEGKPDKSSPAPNFITGMITYMKQQGTTAPQYGSTATDSEIANAQNFLKAYAVGKDENGNPTGYDSVADLRGIKVHTGDDSKTDETLGYIVNDELKTLENRLNGGNIKDGTLFKLQNGGDKHEAYLILYLGGKLYLVSTSDDETEGGEVATKYNEYTGNKVEIGVK